MEDDTMSILKRLMRHPECADTAPSATNEGSYGATPDAQTGGQAGKPDLLPTLAATEACIARGTQGARCGVVVALTGGELDHELMALACTVASEKHLDVVQAIYGIEVPRTKAVNDDMPTERRAADAALERAAQDAKAYHITVAKEIVQSRRVGTSLVHAATAHGCALLILGLPCAAAMEDATEETGMSELLADVLMLAPFRVWVVRGQPAQEAASTIAQAA
jgi:hypothetical protein